MPSGYIMQPHGTGPGDGTSAIRVTNRNITAAYAIQWRFKVSTNPFGTWRAQGTTKTGLMPGTFTVNFRMRTTGSPHSPPPNEIVTLQGNELETLTVAWNS